MAKPLIQMALDSLDFDQTVALAREVAPYVDIFEIGIKIKIPRKIIVS
jgi:3-keto-L-gulonate-6-phosphate decarboxylase